MIDVPESHGPSGPGDTKQPVPDQIPPEEVAAHPPQPLHEAPPHEEHPIDQAASETPALDKPAQIPPEETIHAAPQPVRDHVTPVTPPPERRGVAPGVLLAASVLVLLVAGYLFWRSTNSDGALAGRFDAVDQRLAALEPRLKALEARPVPVAPPPPDLRPLQQQLAALDQKLTAIDQREAAFEQKPPPPQPLDPPGRAEIAAVNGRIDQMVARQNQLGEAQQSESAKVQGQISQQNQKAQASFADLEQKLEAQVTGLEQKVQGQIGPMDQRLAAAVKNSSQIDTLTTRAARMTAVQGASAALADGRPLGTLPGAPPELAQFATKPPPTEASLRLSYAAAADAARAAGLPPKQDGALLDRMWARAQSTIVVRQGDRVLVGDAVSGILAHAQEQVDAGDLAGAQHTLDQLAGPAAAAMAPWRQQAQSLLDARAALLKMAQS